jgi:hypothetical protein
MTDGIRDPAQSWNAPTIGGYTTKARIDATKYPGWSPLAPSGDLPCKLHIADRGKRPIKPDLVMEAGNMGRNPEFTERDYIDPALHC